MSETNKVINLIIGCDHAAFTLKETLKLFLLKRCINVIDAGTHSKVSVDYPDFGFAVASQISKGKCDLGILICGTGIGMSMVANRFPHVRAALCNNIFTAKISKRHNNSNILVMGARIITEPLGIKITKAWLETKFENGRHQKRLDKFDTINKIYRE